MEVKRVDTKLWLFTLVLVLITLLLLNWLLGKNKVDDIWNYEQLTSASDLIYLGEKVEDRQIYYDLESIVAQYLNSYTDTYSENTKEDKIVYTEYYKYFTKGYRDYYSKDEYIEIAEKFLKKFYINATSEYETMEYMDVEKVVRDIYKLENDVYLCCLKGEYTKNTGYIAIALSASNNAFNLVYVE